MRAWGFWVELQGLWNLGLGRVEDLRCWVYRVLGVEGLGLWVLGIQGVGFRVQGLGFQGFSRSPPQLGSSDVGTLPWASATIHLNPRP